MTAPTVSAFKVFQGRDTTATIRIYRDKAGSPNAGLQPFEHWDLRKLVDNQVPWSLDTSVTKDNGLTTNQVKIAVEASFQEWENASPSIIRFKYVENNLDKVPITRDYWNTISWQDGGDDTTGTTTITVNGSNELTLAVLPGTDGWLQTTPDASDTYFPQYNIIAAGENSKIDSNLNNAGSVGSAIGLGISFFNNRTGEILEFDIVLNDTQYTWSNNSQNGLNDIYDIQSILTHEIGHVIGIAHSNDVQMIAKGLGFPNTTCVAGGADGISATCTVEGDDTTALVGGNEYVYTGNNGICETTATGNDVQEIDRGKGASGYWAVQDGEDNVLETVTGGDDQYSGNNIHVGANGISESGYALGDVPTMNKYTNPFFVSLEQRSIEQDDINACNFLYSMDMGDAPDPKDGLEKYPTRIHDPDFVLTGGANTLNGVSLRTIDKGAVHWFGTTSGTVNFRYEWLGDNEDGDEGNVGEAKVNNDSYDDGLTNISGNPVPGGTIKMEIKVTLYNSGEHTGTRYLNAWADWNNDQVWDNDTEKIIGTNVSPARTNPAGTQTFTTSTLNSTVAVEREYEIKVPSGSNISEWGDNPGWLRIRLDYEEDVGAKNKIIDVEGPHYAAIFGEVEDYPLWSTSTPDTTPPHTTKTLSSTTNTAGWHTSPTTVTLTVNEVAKTYYKLSEGSWTTYTEPFALPQGETTIYFYSVDMRNNTETVTIQTHKVDYTSPTVPDNLMPVTVSETSFSWAWGDSSDAHSGLSHYILYRAQNWNGPWDNSTQIATVTPDTTYYADAPAPREIWYYAIWAVDKAGNASSISRYIPYVYMNQSIGPSGGTINTEDNRVSIQIPNGALSSSKTFTVQTKEIAWPSGLNPIWYMFEVTPSVHFDEAVTLTFEFNALLGSDSGTPAIFWYIEGSPGYWQYLGGSVDWGNHTVSVQVDHFSIFGVAYGNALQGPHGGYSSVTDKCRACHDVHEAAGSYSLLPANTIFDTCQSCHDGSYTQAENFVYGQVFGGEPPDNYGHRMNTGTVVIPGGDTTVPAYGPDNGMTCSNCHSPHGNETRMITEDYYCDATATISDHLLLRDPGRATGTALSYGSKWCTDCHDRRHNERAGIYNHPVSLGLTYLSASIARDNTNFQMDPVNPTNTRTEPICQHCHEDKRDVESPFTQPTEPTASNTNPKYNNFPHEAENRYLVAETGDDLCLNCHPPEDLP
jgi:hypothetical protein